MVRSFTDDVLLGTILILIKAVLNCFDENRAFKDHKILPLNRFFYTLVLVGLVIPFYQSEYLV